MDSRTFFQVGGPLDEDSPSYVERPADAALLAAVERGELCLVLAPRQTGKSSLMVHARVRLKHLGMAAGIVDFQALGSHRDLNAWFRDVVYQIERSLRLETDTLGWWDEHQRLGPTQRFMTFLEDVVLGEIEGRVVIFFDEIDSILPLPFSDDFFTSLRALYGARASNATLRRLTFVLLGVASPSGFVKQRSRTPFNIGRQIDLDDFDPALLAPFQEVLGPESEALVDHIFYWTAGQPLMVQKLTEELYGRPAAERTTEQVDKGVQSSYLISDIETDTHLKFIRDYVVEDNPKLRKTLKTYQAVLEGKEVRYDDHSPVHTRLKLAGIVRAQDRKLVKRNRIYEEVFDTAWVKENTPRDLTKIVAYGASSALVLILVWMFLLQPILFPKFTNFRISPGFGEAIFYIEESTLTLNLSLPTAEIATVELNDQKILWKGDEGTIKTDRFEIRLDDLPVGASEHRLRFYGGLWRENFETRFLVASYPRAHWQPLTDLHMIDVAGGCFQMGCGDWDDECVRDEKLVDEVCIEPFRIGMYEVTQDQWQRLMGYNPSWFEKGGPYPLENASWNDVQVFIRRLNQMTGERYRLPAEAEWEFAARSGGKPEKYAGGSDLDALAWYSGNSGGSTHPVGQKAPNGLGLYDMSGNVWEWVEDDWHDSYKAAPKNGRAWMNDPRGAYRVLRGGGWFNDAQFCRAAYRNYDAPDIRGSYLGFRLARSVSLGS